MNSNKTALFFFQSGLGNSIHALPLIARIKERDKLNIIALVANDKHKSLLSLTGLFDKIILYQQRKLLITVEEKIVFPVDYIYLPYHQLTKATFLFSLFRAKKLILGRKISKLNWFPHIEFSIPQPNRHEIANHVDMIGKEVNSILDIENIFKWKTKKNKYSNYIVIHPFAEYNRAPYKNWPLENWIELIKILAEKYSEKTIIIVGTKMELDLFNFDLNNVIVEKEKTDIDSWVDLLINSEKVITVDTAALHIAAMSGVPTCSLWGGTDPKLYGYAQFDSEKHIEINMNKSCAPCESYLNKNLSRVSNAMECPDYACMREMKVNVVFNRIKEWI